VRKREWTRCKDPNLMVREVAWLGNHPTDGAPPDAWCQSHDRRLRLFTLNAGRRLWEQLDNAVCRSAVAVAWRQAEGLATDDEILGQWEALGPVADEATATDQFEVVQLVHILFMLFRHPPNAALELITPGSFALEVPPVHLLTPSEEQACCWLLREIFRERGHVIPIAAAILGWNNSTIPKLAQAIYDDQAFEPLPVLADALEKAGCHDADILAHSRQPAPHVRGCWLVDLLRGHG
jgi:hypothetical protein